jgi:hypothetical protein
MATENSVVKDINKRLVIFGNNLDKKPIFRVVFSNDQYEHRRGEFEEYSGDIYLRTYIGVKKAKKYGWIQSKWILEKWAGGELSYHPDLVTSENGIYVCVYVFEDGKGNALPPLFKVCDIVINRLLRPREYSKALNEDFDLEQKKENSEVEKLMDIMKLHHEETATEKETLSFSKFVEPSKRGKNYHYEK